MYTMGHGSRVSDYKDDSGQLTYPYGPVRIGFDEIMFFNQDLDDTQIAYLASGQFHPGNLSRSPELTEMCLLADNGKL